MSRLFAIAALALWAFNVPLPATAQTLEACHVDFHDMLAAIEANRDSALAEIKRQLASATAEQKTRLMDLHEQVWTQEEMDRRHADLYRRDCLRAAGG